MRAIGLDPAGKKEGFASIIGNKDPPMRYEDR